MMSKDDKKYTVNIKSSLAKKADPKKYKNFDAVYKNYSHWAYRTPWHRFQLHRHKNRKVALFILLILLVLALVIMES